VDESFANGRLPLVQRCLNGRHEVRATTMLVDALAGELEVDGRKV
jgi:hypothetical protein